jgi:selenocysteine lyase/cysteine desulfurase
LNFENNKVNIFVTSFEHHSNYLPWVELPKRNPNVKFNIIPIKDNFDIDIDYLENAIKDSDKDTTNIVSITACSNVLGIKQDIQKIYIILQKYNVQECCYGKKNLLFVDYACSAPYVKIDCTIIDACAFSPHKFLGGVSTPGVLIADKNLFHNQSPFIPGGGCVKSVCRKKIEYEKDIEKREMAGTPNIIGIIRIKQILKLKTLFMDFIEYNEKEISKYVFPKFQELSNKYKNLIIILPDCNIENRLPIVCVAIKDVHYNLIVAILSDKFGIQTRGGVSCTGILAELIDKKYGIKGWCRISFSWLMNASEINYILESIEHILNNIENYKENYEFNKETNLFNFK